MISRMPEKSLFDSTKMFVGDRLIQNLISVKLELLADEKKNH